MDNKMNSNGKQAEVRNDTRDFRRFIEETFAVKEASRFQYPAFSIQHSASRSIWMLKTTADESALARFIGRRTIAQRFISVQAAQRTLYG